jgi:arginine exporter protein ArgO
MGRSMNVRQQYRVLMIISLSMMIGVAVFAGVAIFLTESEAFPPFTGSTAQALRYGATGIVFMGLALASVQGRRRRQAHRESEEIAILKAYTLSVILPQALREGVGFIGIMAGLMTGSEGWIVIFAAASVTSQIQGRPRMGDLETMLRRASGAVGKPSE